MTVAEFRAVLMKELDARAEEIKTHSKAGIEVTNELVSSHKWTNSSILANEPDTDIRMFEMACRYFPQDKLLVHDCELSDVGRFGCRSPYYLQIHDLLRRGAQIDKIGVQNHIFMGVSGDQAADLPTFSRHFIVDRLYNGLKTLSSFGKPIGITEVTIPTLGDESLEAEQLQADMLRVLYPPYSVYMRRVAS